MDTRANCPLCGLPSDSLPRRPRDEMGVSCQRCGEFYIDGMLIYKGQPPVDEIRRGILSGYSRWARISGLPPVEITTANIDEIIESRRQLTQYDKLDLLLKFFSIKEARPGHFINYDIKLDIPVIYSADPNEFGYLVSDFGTHELGYLDYVARSTVKIKPKGWQRIERIKKIQLADDKFEIINEAIEKETAGKLKEAAARASMMGTFYSSPHARRTRDILLESTKAKLRSALSIDKEIIFGSTTVKDPEGIGFLIERIDKFWSAKRELALRSLGENYERCRATGMLETDKAGFLREIENGIKVLKIDLRAAESGKEGMQTEEKTVSNKQTVQDPRRVFVVHGRNEKAKDAMFTFLRTIGLDPIEWGEAVMMTKKGAPYVGEIIDEAFNMAPAIIVLLTGDDMACMREEYLGEDEPSHEKILTPQARTNVIFEAGRAFGTHPNGTILVQLEGEITRPFSDIGGRHVVKISNKPEKKKDLADRLAAAGCAVSIGGKTDWLSAGDFDGAVLSAGPLEIGIRPRGKDDQNDDVPVEILLKILKESPRPVSAEALEDSFHDHQELMKTLWYCREKGLIEAQPIKTDSDGIVDFQGIEITADGIDYLKGRG